MPLFRGSITQIRCDEFTANIGSCGISAFRRPFLVHYGR
ncbi:hypothetical protein MNBD_ALPHA05-1078 [hydrothermal vent metagenome]|uniref:Uncharacterized protein n=1 Tax=hydrothermal vent metagenome TaxID=652676 RepID=A0A3B0SLC1_9ZZZZ